MNHSRLAVLALASFASAAFAQATDFQGKWTSPLVGQSGNELAVDLTLNESGGTWRMTTQQVRSGRNNPCLGKEFPVNIVSQSSPDVVLEISGSKVISGCIDQTASLKLVDGKTLQGTLKDGRALMFVRQ